MKKVLLIATSVVLSFGLKAQITLDASTAPSVAVCQTEDTFNNVKIGGPFPDVSAKTNGTWDFTVAADSNGLKNFNAPISSTAFPSASFTILGQYPFSGLSYLSNDMYHTSSTGVLRYGEHLDRQALSIAALTGDTKDSLVFIDQDVVYENPENRLKYPITMSTTWTSVAKFSTKFQLTVTSNGLNKTPGERRSVRTVKFTVIGWGKLRVNDLSGNNPSGYMDVLQMKEEHATADSFFIGGSPAPPSLLAAFGLFQGQVTQLSYLNFGRKGEYRELVQINYTDNTYTTMTSCSVHKQRLPKPVGVSNIQKQDISIYPNPVANNDFTVKVDGINSNINYELYNMVGQAVANGQVPANGVVSLQTALPSGTYFVKLQTADGAYGVKQISIMN